jgi:hypothetical protein
MERGLFPFDARQEASRSGFFALDGLSKVPGRIIVWNVVEETFCIVSLAFLRPAPRMRRRDSTEGSSRRYRQNPRRKA